MTADYEKLGALYLGRETGGAEGAEGRLLLLDSRDLTTHGVIIGMTGSGKTGLGIALLEEAAMDRIPVLAIDPKGDLGNLFLTFPDLAPADFAPWVNPETARQKDLDPAEFAAQQAAQWRQGLADWGQDGDRIRRLREHAEFAVYTPGSAAGRPVSVLTSLEAPPTALLGDPDAFRDRVQGAVSGLLGLLGIDADPVQSRDHILLSTILDGAWREGRSLDLGGLIGAIQEPPFTRVGVMELEAVYPARERFALAMRLNALLASPGFQAWMEGDPLDIGSLLYTAGGKPRVAIFSIAHLDDAQRMFFVTMLLSSVLAWTRSQPGTTSLRALLYMDEVFGFFPPTANPPSKAPMLTLLKQARAYGVGVVLATQNPVDLDYKGLGNAGTWFIGRLQTDRDKARVLEALDGAMAGSTPMPRAELDRLISGLGKRVFLMHSVHRGAPTLFSTRWVMSYLAGPLTLAQLRTLAGPPAALAAPAGPAPTSSPPPSALTPGEPRPVLPPGITQFFIPTAAGTAPGRWRPVVLARAEVRYSQARHGVDELRAVTLLVPLEDGPIPFALDRAAATDLDVDRLPGDPPGAGTFMSLPAEAAQPRSYDRWGKELTRWIQGNLPITLFEARQRKLVSRVGESEREFRIRLAEAAREARDDRADKVRRRFEPRLRTLEDRLRRAEQAVERKKEQSQQAMLNTGVAAVGGLLGAMFGGRRSQIGRAGTAVRGAGRVAQSRQEAARAGETVEAVRAQLADLEAELARDLEQLDDPGGGEEALEEVAIRPALTAITMRLVALAWVAEP